MNDQTFRYAVKRASPVVTGYIVLGMGFGILLQDKGYSAWWSFLMAALIYGGSLQYVGIDLMAGGAGIVSAALLSAMISARQLFYGLAMVERYHDLGRAKPYAIFSLTDETYSVLCERELPEGVDEKRFYVLVSVINQLAWVLGCVGGAVAGAYLHFDTTGVDFIMTALFVVIFTEQWEKTKEHGPAILGLAVSVVCRVLFGADGFLLPAMIGITVGLFAMRKQLEAKEEGARTE